MRKLCPTGDTLWLACLTAITPDSITAEYYPAQLAYRHHKNTCAECKALLQEYFIEQEERDTKARSAHCGNRK